MKGENLLMTKSHKSRRTLVALIVSVLMVFGLAAPVYAAPENGESDENDGEVVMDGQLETPELRAYFRIIGGVNPNPHIAWDAIEGAVDYMVYVYDVDPDENPDAAPVRERLASAPVAPDIASRGGMAGAEAIEGQRPALGVSFEFDPQNPAVNIMANFFTGSRYITNPAYSPDPPLPQGEYWFRVRALAEDAENNSELSNAQGPYLSLFIDAAAAIAIIGDGVAGTDFLLIDLRGFGYTPGVGPVPNLEFEQQGRLRGALEGYRLDVMPLDSFPAELMDFDRDLPVFVICLGGLRSRNAAVTLAGFPELAADATGRDLADFEDFVPFTRVYDIGGINQWPYGRILSAPTAPIAGGIPNPTPQPTVVGSILTWGALPDNVTYNVYVFANADDTDPADALVSRTGIRGNGFRFPAGVSPQPTSEAVTLDLSQLGLSDGAYFVRIQGIVDPTVNGVATWGEDSPLTEAIPFWIGDAVVTRAMFVQSLAYWVEADLADFWVLRPSFNDVPADGEELAAIEWAVDLGVIEGVGEGAFAPDRSITREQLATMLYRYMLAVDAQPGEGAEFTDQADVSPWAAQAVEAGVVPGLADGSFAPRETVTDAEVQAILARFIEMIS